MVGLRKPKSENGKSKGKQEDSFRKITEMSVGSRDKRGKKCKKGEE